MMTPEQALQLLDLAASAAMGNRQDHENVKIATQALAGFIADVRANFVRKEDVKAHD